MTETRRTFAAALLVVALALLLVAMDAAFFVKDDFQLEFLPASKEIAEAWMHGEVPLLSRYSWLCAGLAAEYQFGVFSIFRMLLESGVWLLPLSLIARGTMLFIVHAAVTAAGAFLLARRYGATPASATLVALVAALNGWMLWWGTTWYAISAGFAWLPWFWLALRRILEQRGRYRWAGAAFSLYLLITAGAPYVVAMAAAVTIMHVGLALARRRLRVSLEMIGSSALGLALSAPAVLMLLEYWPYTARQTAATLFESTWFVPIGAFFGAIVPSFSVAWPVFVGSLPHAAVELLGAFVPVVAIAAAFRRDFLRRHAAELLLLAVLLVLLLLPSAGPFRWSFRWLPLFHLALAIVGATALDAGRRVPFFALGALGITAVASLGLDFDWRMTLHLIAVAGLLCGVWLLLARRDHRFAPWMPVVITMVMTVLTFNVYSHHGETPIFEYEDALLSPVPLDPSRRYLAMYGFEQIVAHDDHGRVTRGINASWRPGNIPMLAGVELVNGYSPLGLAALRNIFQVDVHGPMEPGHARGLLERESGPNQLLHHAGIDGLLVPESMARPHAPLLARHGWRPVARIGEVIVLHRTVPATEPLFGAGLAVKVNGEQNAYHAIFRRATPYLPVVLLTPGASQAERYGRRAFSNVDEGRNHTSLRVGPGPKALFVFRRPWMPGWRATIDGRDLPVLRANMIMPAVEVPQDTSGELRLVYRPRSLVAGAWIALAALAVLALVSLRGRAANVRGALAHARDEATAR